MAAHRYWAISTFARSGSGNGVGIAEVEMRGSAGGANLCVGGTASGVSNFGQTPAMAFDGSASTHWHNAATGGLAVRLSYDFGTPVSVAEMFFRNVAASGAGYALSYPGSTYGPAFTRVEWSDDGIAWRLGGPASDLTPLGNAEATTIGPIVDFVSYAGLGRPASLQAFPPTWPARIVGLTPPPPVYRAFWGGLGRIVGTTKIKGTPNTPVSRRVRLIREVDAVCVGERWSDPVTGAYAFNGFDPLQLYTVIVYDGPRVFRAAVQDAVVPEVYTP